MAVTATQRNTGIAIRKSTRKKIQIIQIVVIKLSMSSDRAVIVPEMTVSDWVMAQMYSL